MTHHDHECRAVTGACLLTRRECFDMVDGFDETLPVVTNDTDYCLRLAEKGYSSVIASGAVLIHDEGERGYKAFLETVAEPFVGGRPLHQSKS